MIKKVIIHFGPPKTGSSAIQKCLMENQSVLTKNGIYYPNHNTDLNGVSSGNVECVCSLGKDGRFYVDQDKIDKLKNSFHASTYQVLVLSSEAFFRLLQPISAAFPGGLLVGYIRDPLEFKESIYNQSVKRHGNTKNIELPDSMGGFQLEILTKMLTTIGRQRFKLIAYSQGLNGNSDVVTDFLGLLDVKDVYYRKEVINKSYSHEALQFKKTLNHFALDTVESEIDFVLQSYKFGIKDYTYIPKKAFKSYKNDCEQALTSFSNQFEVENILTLLENLKTKQERVYLEQKLSEASLNHLILFVRDNYPELFLKLCAKIFRQSTNKTEISLFKSRILGVLCINVGYVILKILFAKKVRSNNRLLFIKKQIWSLVSRKGSEIDR